MSLLVTNTNNSITKTLFCLIFYLNLTVLKATTSTLNRAFWGRFRVDVHHINEGKQIDINDSGI